MRPALGSRTGTGAWLVQRATAVLLAVALPLLLGAWLVAAPQGYAEWRALFDGTPVKLAVFGTGVAVALHAWVGVRDIFMDYVHPLLPRLALTVATVLTLAACVAWLAAVLWGHA